MLKLKRQALDVGVNGQHKKYYAQIVGPDPSTGTGEMVWYSESSDISQEDADTKLRDRLQRQVDYGMTSLYALDAMEDNPYTIEEATRTEEGKNYSVVKLIGPYKFGGKNDRVVLLYGEGDSIPDARKEFIRLLKVHMDNGNMARKGIEAFKLEMARNGESFNEDI